MSANEAVRKDLLHFLDVLQKAARLKRSEKLKIYSTLGLFPCVQAHTLLCGGPDTRLY
jgi:hypothetical protein